MDIVERTSGAVTVITLSGQLTLGTSSEKFKDKINSLVQQGRRGLVVDLDGVSYIDSAGLGQLVAAYTTATRGGGRMVLVNKAKRTHDLLSITKLLTVFDVYESEEEAVRSFAPAVSA